MSRAPTRLPPTPLPRVLPPVLTRALARVRVCRLRCLLRCRECRALAFVFVSLLNLSPPDDAAPSEQRTQYLRSPLFSSKPLSEKVREWMHLARSAWAPAGEGACTPAEPISLAIWR